MPSHFYAQTVDCRDDVPAHAVCSAQTRILDEVTLFLLHKKYEVILFLTHDAAAFEPSFSSVRQDHLAMWKCLKT